MSNQTWFWLNVIIAMLQVSQIDETAWGAVHFVVAIAACFFAHINLARMS
jgi:hypothetical protein